MELVPIDDSDLLYRRIHPAHIDPDGHVIWLAYRLPKNPDNRMSVDLAKLTNGPQHTAKDGRGVGAIEARVPRRLGLRTFHDPVHDNYAHSSIEGDNTRQRCHALAEHTEIVIQATSAPGR